jgi:hypothetical protein
MDELHALPYLDSVVREALRLYSPVAFSTRMVFEDDVLPLSTPYVDKQGREYHGLPCVHISVTFSGPNAFVEFRRASDCTFRSWPSILIKSSGEKMLSSSSKRSTMIIVIFFDLIRQAGAMGEYSRGRQRDPGCLGQYLDILGRPSRLHGRVVFFFERPFIISNTPLIRLSLFACRVSGTFTSFLLQRT